MASARSCVLNLPTPERRRIAMGEESEMAVILPSGWKNFEGGGSDANFAGLPQLLRRQHAPFLLCTGATRCKSTNSEVLFSPLPEL